MAGTGRVQRRLPPKPALVKEKYLTGPTLNIPIEPCNLGERYLNFLSQQPEKIHQVDAQTGITETKGCLQERAIILANAMIGKGIKSDDKVIICSKCHFDMTATLLACLLTDVIFVPINPDFTFDELQWILSVVVPKMAFCDLRPITHINTCLKKLQQQCTMILYGTERRSDMILFNSFIAKQRKFFQPLRSTKDVKQKICFIFPTQGTTGFIKLCECSVYSIMSRTRIILDCFLRNCGKVLSYMPINSADQLVFICATLETNITRILPGAFSARNFCKLVHDLQIDTAMISTEYSLQLLYQQAGVYDFNLSCLSLLLIFGYVISNNKIKNVMRTFPSVEIYSVYCSTEAGPISYTINNSTSSTQPFDNPVAKLVPGIHIYVENSETKEHVGPNVVGELMIGGPQLMTGYYKSPQLNTASFRKGFFRSGDIISYDTEGNISVKGNSYDIIRRQDATFSTMNLEDVIAKYRGIREVAVVSNDKEIVACIVKHESCTLTLDILQAFISDKVPEIWIPNRLRVYNQFPKTTLGKVKKFSLMEDVFSYERDESVVSSLD